ncbi:MAG: xanthine dehydrogenase accessory protein XdhC [Rhizobiales bacterium]|nr:xanthine dehydrogenase accessory protein XdhC [Hyphomicrobiales bacterium]
MRAWLGPLLETLEQGEAAILVHVAELEGSGPRETGAQMLVTESGIFDTIGGGELEHTATLKARELLVSGRAGLVRLALGPELNQCCGGSVTLAFEPFAPADLAWVKKLVAAAMGLEPAIRVLALDESGGLRRDWLIGQDGPAYLATRTERGLEIQERLNPPVQALWLFGAGHVGRAVAKALHPLGFALTWVDGRAGQFPEPALPGVRQLALAMPELIVDEAPAGAAFLVMTHSHALDEAICEAVLRREEFGYLGLIGSKTKRARFRRQLGESGIAPALLARMICPIGLTEIESKEPTAIAASVAADMLIRRERHLLRAKGPAHHER